MSDPLAGRPVPHDRLVNVPRLVAAYYTDAPDPDDPGQRVAFGTSGHRGSSLDRSFNDAHVAAIARAVADVRSEQGTDGPLVLGADTHALSEPALRTALEVFAAAGVSVVLDADLGYVPTPVVSHAILTRNAAAGSPRADGVVITPSHNPPRDGGLKYNPPHGGPAGTELTKRIEARANELLASGVEAIERVPFARALRASATQRLDLAGPYIDDLGAVLDMEAIAGSGLKLGVDPMGGAATSMWPRIAERWGLDLEVVNDRVDPTFAFMRLDRDGKVRMDCSSPYAMAGLIELADRFDVAFGNDPDVDRHGIVAGGGLMNPNHFLAAAVDYLFRSRDGWRPDAAIGKTVVTSSILDRIADDLGRPLREVPVGFKWFVDGLLDGSTGFGGEESAGASFVRRDGTVWTTDKDGIILALLAAEITAVSGENPARRYDVLAERHGAPVYRRADAPADDAQKRVLANLDASAVTARELAGEPIESTLTHAPSGGAPIGGLKVSTRNGWFAARPSGTEDIYKIYAESFLGDDHLDRLMDEARALVQAAFDADGSGG
ncbi:MAG: phosphoglucomutase (alpha-D-glucose-1,6-bisphosphate-dependent) [Trueperaceae bacterium]|nr:phosphoglucomutase (alpha-D-glucose-1,6-bisphosphate-dependent) [Trueperaceae bacterium]